MAECKRNNDVCTNLVLRTTKTGRYKGQMFFGCKNYPDCSYLIPLNFESSNLSTDDRILEHAFSCFVRSNSFICATYGVTYFNLRNPAFLDYLLRSEIVIPADDVEFGLSGAKIYYSLFYHLFLIPSPAIKRYLVNNFPKTYKYQLTSKSSPTFFSEGIDYENHAVIESFFHQYKDINTYNR